MDVWEGGERREGGEKPGEGWVVNRRGGNVLSEKV
jgi:hypothetical protein